jgi:hypothetical protein
MKNHARRAVLFLFVALQCGTVAGQSVSGTVNSYYAVTAVNTAVNTVTLTTASGLTPGQRVLLYQAKGAVINSSNSSGYGDITTLNNAGGYEFNTVCSINGNEVWLVYAMLHSYDPAGLVQLVTVPSSPAITVAGALSAASWNPATGTGGIVALESSGTITLNADINVSGQGFLGGQLVNNPIPPYNCDWFTNVSDYYYPLPASGDYTGGMKGEGITLYITNEEYGMGKLANGGGGGNNTNTGGAGGGNYGPGGNGGQRAGESFFSCHGTNPGIGGEGLSAFGYTVASNRIFFGGGGGAGQENNGVGTPGANGGGIILLSAPAIIGGGGRLLASGLQPKNPTNTDPLQAEGDGGGGGGGGGTIILNSTTVSGAVTADVSGGRGSNSSNLVNDCTGPGGGGAGGVAWSAGGVFPAVVSVNLNGGANGVVSSGSSKTACVGSANGATAGSTGNSQTGYSLPVSGAKTCTILANSALQYFTATRTGDDVRLNWALTSPAAAGDIQNFVLQRSLGGNQFDTLSTIVCTTNQETFGYDDAAPTIEGPLAYRLAWVDQSGKWSYSRVIAVPGKPGPDAASLRIFPNPATDRLLFTVTSTTTESAMIQVSNGLGQALHIQTVTLHEGMNTVSVPLTMLSPGVYFLVLEVQGKRVVKPFVKRKD